MAETLIVRADADDVAYFARRRWPDEHSRKLYVDLGDAAPNGVYVAKDEGTPIGIAMPYALEDEWFLCDMFVEPSFRHSGIGRQLFVEAAREVRDATRSCLVQPLETGSMAFLVRRGVSLQTPVLDISGAIPHENELMQMAAGEYRFTTQELEPVAHRSALAHVDRDVRGSARPMDHVYFCAHARGTIFVRDDEIVGYAYVWPSGRIGPVASASPSYAVQFVGFALMALRASFDASWCTMLVPGTNIRVLRATMRAGLKIDGVRLFASDGAMHDLSRYIGFHPLLF